MAVVRSLFELTPAELVSRPMVRRFAPFQEQVIRCAAKTSWRNWFGVEWYWLGRAQDSAHTILVGPFRTKRGAKNAWAAVPEHDPRYFIEDEDGVKHYVEPPSPPGLRAMQQSFTDYHRQ